MSRLGAVLLILLVLGTSCNLINPPEKVPAYIKLENPKVLIDSTNGIYSSLGVKDAWLYQAGNPIGTFSFPAVVPTSNLVDNDFFIDGGVYESGLSSFRIEYPFWQRVHFTAQPEQMDTIVIEPIFEYHSNDLTANAFEEDFEEATIGLNSIALVDEALIIKEYDSVYTGNAAGVVHFNETNKIFDAVSDEFPFVARNVDIYAEVTFKSDFPFTVGLYYEDPAPRRISEVSLFPAEEWTTVYIHLVTLVRKNMVFPDQRFKLWFLSTGGGEVGNLYLDNIKVLYWR